MLESERKVFEKMDGKSPMSKYWMPLVWATNIINRARKEGLISSDHIVQTLLVELSDIRRRLGALIGYDTVCVPLVYTQASFSCALRSHVALVQPLPINIQCTNP
ncbi:Bestrophin-3 [Eumeta japonica]|uniref:Bestrophin homolog n=1 Tax=Eumeta variegata TaxID=151549 RepID=A0A4C1SVR8_EUMVA|nr:Bestrophin-3 [Eumeta japonica]